MFARSFHLGRLAGIAVRLDASLLLFAVLVAWVFGANFLRQHGLVTAALMAVTATLLFLGSVLVHELAHGLEARYRDIPVHGITLFFFGGMTEMHAGSRSPRDEFAVSAVGPYASLVCGAAFGLIAASAPLLGDALAAPVAGVAGLLAWLNLFLAAFNLVPGAPLDGGRVLRAGLWWLLGDRGTAIHIATRAGQTLAAALVLTGVSLLVTGLFTGADPARAIAPSTWARLAESPVFGIVLVLVGAFIFQAARTELAQHQVDRLLDEGRVHELLGEPTPVTEPVDDLSELSPQASLRELVDRLLEDRDAVVIRDGAHPVAVLSEREVARGLERLRRDRAARRRRGKARPRRGALR
jgi:Zn-dependent protease